MKHEGVTVTEAPRGGYFSRLIIFKKAKKTIDLIIPRAGFARNVTILAGGTALGQGIIALSSPLLTRLYSPTELGILAIYVSILSMLVVIASLRYELAIPLSKDEATVANLVALSMVLVIGTSILVGFGMLLFGNVLVRQMHASSLQPYLWLLPLSLLGAGSYQVLNYWALRRNAFARIAQTKLNQSLGMVATQIGLGLFKIGPLALLLGDVIGRTSGSGTLATLAWRYDKNNLRQVSLSKMRRAASRYRKFPLYSSWSALLNSSGLQLPPLLLAALYGPRVVGLFALARQVMWIPMTLISQSVAQAYIAESTRLVREDPRELRRFFLKTARRLLLLGSIPAAVLALGGPWLFGLIFGDSWREAGLYVRLLSVTFLVDFAISPLSQTLNILERQNIQLMWDGGRAVAVAGAIIIASILKWPAWLAIATYGLAMLVAYIAVFILSDRVLMQKEAERKDAI